MLYISNIELEINNINGGNMKKVTLPILMIIYIIILVFTGLSHLQSLTNESNLLLEYILIGMITVLLISGILLFIKKYKLVLDGVSANDEMSKKIIHRSASFSFFTSWLLWFLISIYFDELHVPESEIFGYGIFGMVTIFVLFLTYYNIKGIRN